MPEVLAWLSSVTVIPKTLVFILCLWQPCSVIPASQMSEMKEMQLQFRPRHSSVFREAHCREKQAKLSQAEQTQLPGCSKPLPSGYRGLTSEHAVFYVGFLSLCKMFQMQLHIFKSLFKPKENQQCPTFWMLQFLELKAFFQTSWVLTCYQV